MVFLANDRCDQENLIAQLKSGVHALTTPVDNLVSNWANPGDGQLGLESEAHLRHHTVASSVVART